VHRFGQTKLTKLNQWLILKNGSINFGFQLSRNFHGKFMQYRYCEAKTLRNVTKVTQQNDFI